VKRGIGRMENLQQILDYIKGVSSNSEKGDCKCKGECSDEECCQEKECEIEEKEFEGCGEECLGPNCECSREKDEDEEDDGKETEEDKKSCCKCGIEQHIRNFISLVNGTQTRSCLTCRMKNINREKPVVEAYRVLKRNMGCCIMCGDTNIDHLEFNHINPKTKKGEVGSMQTLESQSEERKGCNVLCTKCHCIHTFKVEKQHGLKKERDPKDRMRIARDFINEYKRLIGGCQNPGCTDKFDPDNLPFYQFDHIKFLEKLLDISRMVSAGYSVRLIKLELEKCIMLCTYCHRIKTREQLIEKREYFLSLERPLIKRQKQERKIDFENATEIRRLYNDENLNLKPIAE
jgi:hypothetical protein